MNHKAIIFDMDDTLFFEKDYVFSGFKEISIYLNSKFGLNEEASYSFLKERFMKHGRKKIFNYLIDKNFEKFKTTNINILIKDLVEIYRNHKPAIKLNPIIINVLKKVRKKKFKIIIATDGLAIMQKNKFLALGLDKLVDNIIFCWDINAPKPSKKCFETAAKGAGVNIKDCIIVGDHPIYDIVPARMLGCKAYRIKTDRFSNLRNDCEYPPHQSFLTLEEFYTEVINDKN